MYKQNAFGIIIKNLISALSILLLVSACTIHNAASIEKFENDNKVVKETSSILLVNLLNDDKRLPNKFRYDGDFINPYSNIDFAAGKYNLKEEINRINEVSFITPDIIYMNGIEAIKERNYKKAIKYLCKYRDLNTAIAFLALDYNASALQLLESLPPSEKRDYMLAIAYARTGNKQRAIQYFISSKVQNVLLCN